MDVSLPKRPSTVDGTVMGKSARAKVLRHSTTSDEDSVTFEGGNLAGPPADTTAGDAGEVYMHTATGHVLVAGNEEELQMVKSALAKPSTQRTASERRAWHR